MKLVFKSHQDGSRVALTQTRVAVLSRVAIPECQLKAGMFSEVPLLWWAGPHDSQHWTISIIFAELGLLSSYSAKPHSVHKQVTFIVQPVIP